MVKIYKYLDDPPQIFLWDIDDVVVFSAMLLIGIITEMLALALVVGVVVLYLLQKTKATNADGFLQHFLYWHGLIKIKDAPPSYLREFIE